MDQHFRIRLAFESVSQALEMVTEFTKIIDCPVEYDSNRSVGRKHRLSSSVAGVEDGKSAMSQHGSVPDFDAFAIRASSSEHTDHSADGGNSWTWFKLSGNAGNSTHALNLEFLLARLYRPFSL
jgi:hypothetical protein